MVCMLLPIMLLVVGYTNQGTVVKQTGRQACMALLTASEVQDVIDGQEALKVSVTTASENASEDAGKADAEIADAA